MSGPGGGRVTEPAGGELVEPDPHWRAWSPEEVGRRLAGCPARWAVAAGWAVDLFLGRRTREHDDLEVAVPAADFPAVRAALPGLEFEVIGSGRRWPLADPAFGVCHQTWGRDRRGGPYRVDVFREPHDGDTWVCRRDPTLRRPYAEVIRRTGDGLPYLAPEIVLLFKARHDRPKDRADLAVALPRLDPPARAWLHTALTRIHPEHPWLPDLHR
jgi:hypothetical protein